MKKDRIINSIFYISIGLLSSLCLFLAFYYALRLNATLSDVFENSAPAYLAAYVGLTLATVILFGVNISLFIYRIRKYGFPKLTGQLGAGLGSALGLFASACPVCGSTLLSALGIAGGLSAFPMRGLEIKAASLLLMALPVWLMVREMRKFECGTKACPTPRDAAFKESDSPWLVIIFALIIGVSFITFNMFRAGPAAAAQCLNAPAVKS
jgi:hypothetical protein